MKLTDWLVPKGEISPLSSPPSPLAVSKTFSSSKENFEKMPPKERKSEPAASSSRMSGGTSSTMTTVNGFHSARYRQELTLPQSKIKVIMKSSPEIDQVSHDVLFLISKATELFIDHITNMTYLQGVQGHKLKNMEYRNLAEMVQTQANLEFLRDIVPKKMLARDALKEVAKHSAQSHKELLGD